jgi:hypothetical protein
MPGVITNALNIANGMLQGAQEARNQNKVNDAIANNAKTTEQVSKQQLEQVGTGQSPVAQLNNTSAPPRTASPGMGAMGKTSAGVEIDTAQISGEVATSAVNTGQQGLSEAASTMQAMMNQQKEASMMQMQFTSVSALIKMITEAQQAVSKTIKEMGKAVNQMVS